MLHLLIDKCMDYYIIMHMHCEVVMIYFRKKSLSLHESVMLHFHITRMHMCINADGLAGSEDSNNHYYHY